MPRFPADTFGRDPQAGGGSRSPACRSRPPVSGPHCRRRKGARLGSAILSDYEGLRIDLTGLRSGLSGSLRLGVIPAAMRSFSCLTARFSSIHPAATVEVMSMTSRSIQKGLDSFELDAGVTYLDNEPLEHVRRFPLYKERYIFVTSGGSRYAGRRTISWREAAEERLCLLSPDMQNRRIIDAVFNSLEIEAKPPVVQFLSRRLFIPPAWRLRQHCTAHIFLCVCRLARFGGDRSCRADARPGHRAGHDGSRSLAVDGQCLIAATGGADLEDGLAAAARGKVDQAFLSIVQNISLDKDVLGRA